MPWITNPAVRGDRLAVEITDRAKRYRAQGAIQQTEKRCIYCGAPPARGRRLDVEHINGREADGSPENLAYSCRPCNTAKGSWFARLGLGKRTRQNNPRGRLAYDAGVNAKPIRSLGQWVLHLDIVRGHTGADSSTVRKAADRIKATPPNARSGFAAEVWRQRRARGTDSHVPF